MILIILSTIAINMAFGDNGLVKYAEQARDMTEEANDKEKIGLAILEAQIGENGYRELDETILEKVLSGKFEGRDLSVTDNEDGTFTIVFSNNIAYDIDKNGNIKYFIIPDNSVAKMGQKCYSSIQTAIDEANNDKNIVLLSDIYENIYINENKNITLVLNNKMLSSKSSETTVTINGVLTIKGKGEITNTSNHTINNYGTLKINEGSKITSTSQSSTIYNDTSATTIISGATIISEYNNAINNMGSLKIDDASMISSNSNSYSSISNKENGYIEMKNGIIDSISNNAINNYGEIIITGTVKISGHSDEFPVIHNREGGTITMLEGTVTSDKSTSIYNEATLNLEGNSEIISNTATTIENTSSGKLTVNGSTITNLSGNYAIYNSNGQISISNAEINGKINY